MPANLELKAALRSLQTAETTAKSLPARRMGILHQTDTYFQIADGRLKLREIRGSGAELIRYVRPNHAGVRRSEYTRIAVKQPAAVRRLLSRALGIRSVVRKRRILFRYRNARIHLDTVNRLGAFLEFEVMVRRGLPQARRLMTFLRRRFRIRARDVRPGSYGDMILRRKP